MFVNDLAEACLLLMQRNSEYDLVNIGSGEEISILNLALMIKDIIGFRGEIVFDSSKPDGTPRKLLDNSRLLSMGYCPKIKLRQGLELTYKKYINSIN